MGKRINQMHRTRGFTIVELLIVIVVIGILAAITIVAFNGVQERSRMASAQAFAAQMERKYKLTSTGLWKFNECSGTTVASESAQPVTATVSGTLTWSTDTPSGSGCAAQLNGSTRIRTTATLDTNYYFKAAWIKLSGCSANNIVSRPDSGGQDGAFWANSCILRAGHDANYGRISSPNTLETGKWHHVAVEFDNGTYRLFENGKKVAESSGHPALVTLDPGMNIGAHGAANYLTGLIDDVIVSAGKPEF